MNLKKLSVILLGLAVISAFVVSCAKEETTEEPEQQEQGAVLPTTGFEVPQSLYNANVGTESVPLKPMDTTNIQEACPAYYYMKVFVGWSIYFRNIIDGMIETFNNQSAILMANDGKLFTYPNGEWFLFSYTGKYFYYGHSNSVTNIILTWESRDKGTAQFFNPEEGDSVTVNFDKSTSQPEMWMYIQTGDDLIITNYLQKRSDNEVISKVAVKPSPGDEVAFWQMVGYGRFNGWGGLKSQAVFTNTYRWRYTAYFNQTGDTLGWHKGEFSADGGITWTTASDHTDTNGTIPKGVPEILSNESFI